MPRMASRINGCVTPEPRLSRLLMNPLAISAYRLASCNRARPEEPCVTRGSVAGAKKNLSHSASSTPGTAPASSHPARIIAAPVRRCHIVKARNTIKIVTRNAMPSFLVQARQPRRSSTSQQGDGAHQKRDERCEECERGYHWSDGIHVAARFPHTCD